MKPSRAYYDAPVEAFLTHSSDAILGQLVRNHSFSTEDLQKNAWKVQIAILKEQLLAFSKGHLFLEFTIPRMGRRVDAILVYEGIVYLIEFKIGTSGYERSGIDQATDYALDLSNFHEGSHSLTMFPILCATHAPVSENGYGIQLGVNECAKANRETLSQTLQALHLNAPGKCALDPLEWAASRYLPTPTIVEAAEALYRNHDVTEISRSEAGAINLTQTAATLSEIIERSKSRREKAICFVTGVPGAGKTLAGLNLACSRRKRAVDEHAVFLSGNGPLVAVLREALARDQSKREKITKGKARSETEVFIQNIHHFRDDGLRTSAAPIEKVVVFDEAQRAWDHKKLAKFMAERGKHDFTQSEPELLISLMDRHSDWCTVICLIGGGQEINEGEAGISAWFSAIGKHFPHWKMWSSPKLGIAEYSIDESSQEYLTHGTAELRDSLHLSVSLRSFRAESLSEFVHEVLGGNINRAKAAHALLKGKYPVRITRDLNAARQWLRDNARGSELKGLLACSGGYRLKADGLYVKAGTGAVEWFLNDKEDVRSCHYLEDVATEFDVQGLELDWIGVCWDGDLRKAADGWGYFQFSGSDYKTVRQGQSQRYLINSYRVLLTRGRQGLVVYVPPGSAIDPTRSASYYDPTYAYLLGCGFEPL